MGRNCQFIGAFLGWGAQDHSCEEGPDVIKRYLDQHAISAWESVRPHVHSFERLLPQNDRLDAIVQVAHDLSTKVYTSLQHSQFPIVLGGDHSIAIGTWNGVALDQNEEPFGLIWLDAHMDGHTPQTTPSGAWHGMVLAALLGYGEEKLSHLKKKSPVIDPQHVCLIGARSYEKEEAELLEKLNVRIFTIDEVHQKGLQKVVLEAAQHISKGVKRFGVSLDLDVIDPTESPGVGTPEPYGVSKEALLESLLLLSSDERLIAFELVEYNPKRDFQEKTLNICLNILQILISGKIGVYS